VAGPLEALRLLAPVLFAIALVTLSYAPRLTRLGQSSWALLALVLSTALLTSSPVGYRDAFHGLLGFVGRYALTATIGLSFLAAGSELRLPRGELPVDDVIRRCCRWLMLAGSSFIVVLYLLPQRGKPLFLLVFERIVAAIQYSGWRAVGGMMLYWLLALLPLGLAVGGLVALRRGARPGILLGLTARYGLSALTMLLCFRLLFDEPNPHSVLLQLRTATLLAVAVSAASGAIDSVVRHLVSEPLPPVAPPSRLARDVRLRQLVRCYLQRDPQGAGDQGNDLLTSANVPQSHPWLRWLMRRRVVELNADVGPAITGQARARGSSDGLLKPDRTTARAYLSLLCAELPSQQSTPVRPHPANETSSPADQNARSVQDARRHPGLWLATGRVRIPAAIAAAVLLTAGTTALFRHRPKPDLTFKLGTPRADADQLFGTDLPRYIAALSLNAQGKSAGSEESPKNRVLVQRVAQLRRSAERVDERLAGRVSTMIRVADKVDRTGRLWLDAVHGLNQRIRDIGLPYYVDGNGLEVISRTSATIRQLFYVTTYRVERIVRLRARGRQYATLYVRRLDKLNIGGRRLGMVRHDEPFALVMVDAIDQSVDRRLELLRTDQSCGVALWRPAELEWPSSPIGTIDRLCAQSLSRLLENRGWQLEDHYHEALAQLRGRQRKATERHEIQHQVDGMDIPIPTELFELLPNASETQLTSVSQELSAHLAELATDDSLATVWLLADMQGHLLAPKRGRAHYRLAVGLLVGALLDQPVFGPRGRLKPAKLAEFWRRIAADESQAANWIAPAAQRAHQRFFGEPIGPFQPVD